MRKALITLIILLIIVMIIVIPVALTPSTQESMTRIRRGVGFLNDADEQPVAAGIIHSAPILDYTYTYWDGEKATSCDECPNEIVCPKCPQWSTTEHLDLSIGGHGNGAAVADFDSDYAQSRERRGASMPAGGLHPRVDRAPLRENLSVDANDHTCPVVGGYSQRGAWSRPVNDFLYNYVNHSPLLMSCDDPRLARPPSTMPPGCCSFEEDRLAQDDCVFYNTIGLQYKEPCQYSSSIISALSQPPPPIY
jgi:hypothetical protein